MLLCLFLLAFQDTVVNDMTPVSGSKIKVVKDLTLGTGDSDEEIFSVNAAVAESADGTIYILDWSNERIAVFDKSGKFVRNIGKKGQGPGEFTQPEGIAIDPKGRVAVFDIQAKKLNFLDEHGKLLEEKRLPQGTVKTFNPDFTKDGGVVYLGINLDAQFQSAWQVTIYNPELEPIKVLHSKKMPPKDWSRAREPQFWVEFLRENFEQATVGFPYFTILANGNIVASNGEAYEGEIYDPSGKMLSKFSKKYKRTVFTEEEQRAAFTEIWDAMRENPFLASNVPKPVFEEAVRTAEIPDYASPMFGLYAVGNGFVTVHNYSALKRTGVIEAFDAKGRFVGSGTINASVLQCRGGKNALYVVGSDEDDNIVVNRFKIEGL